MPVRVLHLNSLLTGGGTDDRSVRIAHALSQLGHEVWMAGPAGRQYTTIAQELGLLFKPLRTAKPALILGTARLLRQHRIQVIHARHGRDYWPAILAARISGVRPRVVLSRHLAKSPSSFMSRRFLLGQCNAMVAVSEFVAHVLREGDADPASENPERHYRPPLLGDHSKIHVVYGGFDMARFQPAEAEAQRRAWGLQPDHYAFGVVGVYDQPRGKGQPEFVEAAARISAGLPNARFLIIGRGSLKPNLEKRIGELGLAGVVQLTPYCHDMPAAMNALDCLVLPQVGTEAIPGVVCEAHACGKPIIASNLDGIPEAFRVGNYGELVPPADVPALASAMQRRAGRPPLGASERIEIHRKVAERFSLERAARDLSALYERVLAQ